MSYPGDRDGPVRSRRILLGLVIALVAGAMVGTAVILQVRGWGLLQDESGGACGRAYGACPRGSGGILVGSFFLGFVSIPVAGYYLFKRPRFRAVAVLAGAAAGAFGGLAAFTWLHGTDLPVDWTAPYDSSSQLTTAGVWTDGGSLIRVRLDEIASYQATSGRQQWDLPIPGTDIACAVSGGLTGQVGLVGYGPQGGRCSHVLAVDVADGRELWSRSLRGAWPGNEAVATLAADDGTATVLTTERILGYDAQTGKLRWEWNAPSTCPPGSAAAQGGGVVVLVGCDSGLYVADIDEATGKLRWRTLVPEQQSDYTAALLSAEPAVVDLTLPGARGSDDLLVFGSRGGLTRSISVSSISTPSGPASLDTGSYQGFGPEVIVDGGTLVGVTQPSDGHSDIVAFRLSDGAQQWLTQMPDDVVTARGDGNKFLVIDDSQPTPELEAFSISNGSMSPIGFIPQGLFDFSDSTVYPVGGRFLVVNLSGTNPVPPLAAVGG
jgi:outer membrane protein assembly factor BamB